MSLKPYPAYKESGIDWLGDVPSHWSVNKIGRISKLTVGWTPPTGVPEYFDGANPWANISDLGPRIIIDTERQISDSAVDFSRLKVSPAGSLLFSFKLSVGQVSFAGVDLYTNEAIATFFETASVSLRYAYYAYPLFIVENAGENIYGAKILNQERINNAKISLPVKGEQIAIAEYLDRETAEIDAFITDQEELIELLSERRTATIARAVTKGLDPNAPMKDSGLAWIGSLPDEWAVKRMSWLFRTISSGTTPPNNKPEYYDGEVNWVTTGELRELGITGTKRTLNEIALADLSSLRIYSPGTLLIAMYGATIGRLGFLEVPATTNQACCAFAEPIETNPRFVFYALLAAREHLLVIADGGGQPNINQDKLRSLRIPAPGLGVQNEIVSYLDCETAEIDAAIADAREAIALSKERRTAVISAVVTGKIDVRGLVDPVASDVEGASVGAA